MRSRFSRVVKRSVRAGSSMVSQIVVSVAAAVCVGFITNAYLEQAPGSSEAASTPAVLAPEHPAARSASATLGMAEEGDGDTGQPARPVQATEATIRNVQDAPLAISSDPAAGIMGAPLPPLDSQVVVDLPVSDISAKSAEIFPGVPAEDTLAESLRDPPEASQKPQRRHFLGLPLPSFLSPGQFVQSASAAGGKIVSLVEGH